MRTTNTYNIKCAYCETVYEQTSYSDDGCDYMGHGRGYSETKVKYKKCPHCNHEVKAAYKIIMQREEQEKSDKELKLKKLSEMEYSHIITVNFSTGGKDYKYKAKKEVAEGLYSMVKDTNPDIPNVVIVTNVEEINDSLDLKEVINCESYKKIALHPIDMLEGKLYEKLEGLLKSKHVNKFHTASGMLLQIVNKKISYNLNKDLEKLWMSE